MTFNRQLENQTTRRRMFEGARNYALAEKSDPFAFARAMSHTLNGIANIHNGEDAFYQADPYQETRVLPDGREYNVTAYRNVKRP